MTESIVSNVDRLSPRACMNIVLCLGFCVLAGGIVMILLSGYSQYYNTNKQESTASSSESTLRVFGYAFICAGGVIMLKAAILFIFENRFFQPHFSDIAQTSSSASDMHGSQEFSDPSRYSSWPRIQTYHICYPEFSATAPQNHQRFIQLGGHDIYDSGILTPTFEPRYWDPPPPYPGKSTLT